MKRIYKKISLKVLILIVVEKVSFITHHLHNTANQLCFCREILNTFILMIFRSVADGAGRAARHPDPATTPAGDCPDPPRGQLLPHPRGDLRPAHQRGPQDRRLGGPGTHNYSY